MTMETLVIPPALRANLQTLNDRWESEERRRIEPRQLRDGTWILNADVLTDAAAGRIWWRYQTRLQGLTRRTITDADLPADTIP